MSRYSKALSPSLRDYVQKVGVREHKVLTELRRHTKRLRGGGMQISPEQGALLQMIVRLIQAKRAIEVGTFTGYSTLAVALALPKDGKVTACDVSKPWTDIARRYWRKAGVADKIELRLGPGQATLDGLLASGEAGHYDFAFIDADKTGYDGYYEAALKLLRPGGVIAIDNLLWGGSVVDPKKNDADTRAIRRINAKIQRDNRIDMVLVPVGDGCTLARKRG